MGARFRARLPELCDFCIVTFRVLLSAIVLFFVLLPAARAQRVAMNELMYAPLAPEPEWIELYNGDSIAWNVGGWSIASTAKRVILPLYKLPPGEFLVITKDSSAMRVSQPGDYAIIQVPLPALRNTGDTVILRGSTGGMLDSIPYHPAWGGKNGRSLERRDWRGSGSDSANWGTSLDSTGATPGERNSIATPKYDLGLTNAWASDSEITITIRNVGSDEATLHAFRLEIEGVDTIDITQPSLALAAGDSTHVRIALPKRLLGQYACTAIIVEASDSRRSNDTLRWTVAFPIPANAIVINEIMFAPRPSSCEWIELLNPSEAWVSLAGTNVQIGTTHTLAVPSGIMPPGSFALIASDSSLFFAYPDLHDSSRVITLGRSSLSLSNDSCACVLAEAEGMAIDSVFYHASWHTTPQSDRTGISLERKTASKSSNDPKNWHSSSDLRGATPLAANSGHDFALSDTASTMLLATFSPNPFSPDGDGFEDESELTVRTGDDLPYALRVRLFDVRGRLVRTLADVAAFEGGTTLTFNGRNDQGQLLPLGLYTALVELTSQNPLRVMSKTAGVAIAGQRR